jgi:hypothetical protein
MGDEPGLSPRALTGASDGVEAGESASRFQRVHELAERQKLDKGRGLLRDNRDEKGRPLSVSVRAFTDTGHFTKVEALARLCMIIGDKVEGLLLQRLLQESAKVMLAQEARIKDDRRREEAERRRRGLQQLMEEGGTLACPRQTAEHRIDPDNPDERAPRRSQRHSTRRPPRRRKP